MQYHLQARSYPLIKIKHLTASMEDALLRGDFDVVPAILDKLEAEHGRMEYALYCREKSVVARDVRDNGRVFARLRLNDELIAYSP